MRCRLFCCCICVLAISSPTFASALPVSLTYADPAGDTSSPGGHDIASIGSQVTPESVRFQIEFFGAISPASALQTNSLAGYLDIDLDQDVGTGAASHQSVFGTGSGTNLGVDYFVDLFSEEFTPGFAELINTLTMQPVSMVTLLFGPTQVSIDVPRADLGGDAALNYGVAVGGFVAFSDEARNAGEPPASTVPEPAIVIFIAEALAIGCITRGYRRAFR